MKPHQLQLFAKPSREHGGFIRQGRRKTRRPFDPERAMHIVMRSSKAKGASSFLYRKNKGLIHVLLVDLCARYGVKLYKFENAGNRLHHLVKFPSRDSLRAFLRVFAQGVMFLATGARKGNLKGRFFDAIVYSRVVGWGREFRALKNYLWKNALESLGFSREEVLAHRRAARMIPDS